MCGESDLNLGGCHSSLDFHAAVAVCSAAGARLCTSDEISARTTKGTGCSLDRRSIWSATECSGGGFETMRGGSGKRKTCSDVSAKKGVRCCSDVVLPPFDVAALAGLPAHQGVLFESESTFVSDVDGGNEDRPSASTSGGGSGGGIAAASIAAVIALVAVAVNAALVRARAVSNTCDDASTATVVHAEEPSFNPTATTTATTATTYAAASRQDGGVGGEEREEATAPVAAPCAVVQIHPEDANMFEECQFMQDDAGGIPFQSVRRANPAYRVSTIVDIVGEHTV